MTKGYPASMRIHLPHPEGTRVARLVRREKRFTVHCLGPDGEPLAAHTNNSGSMLGLVREGRRCLLSPAKNPRRKLAWTLEAIAVAHLAPGGAWVGVNTATPNRMLAAVMRDPAMRLMLGLGEYTRFTAEARFEEASGMSPSTPATRFDGRLDGPAGAPYPPPCWLEAKNVTMVEDTIAMFPDAATERGRKHVAHLTALARAGGKAGVFCLVQRPDGQCFGPAEVVDPAFAEIFWEAVTAGVMVWPFMAHVDEAGVTLGARLPLSASPWIPRPPAILEPDAG